LIGIFSTVSITTVVGRLITSMNTGAALAARCRFLGGKVHYGRRVGVASLLSECIAGCVRADFLQP
jgi:hypothetical protein